MNTHPNSPPLQPFPPDPQARPFSTVAVDFIVKLPISNGYDTILTVTDHDCTKAVILLPCREDMGSLDIAKLYLERVFPYVGVPEKIISDRDTRFTSKIFKELCEMLRIKQNVASAYHPQTDGQSEKTNQHVETAL
jgi:transposase InsO family protein